MSQIATFTEPESIPSLEDAPEVTLSEQATEGSIQFLKELGSTVRKELFFTDKVPLFSKEDGERTQVGHSVIIVSEGIARGKSCYFVSINTEAKLSSTTSVSSTITAYVSTQLDTISQSVYEISTNSERFEEHIMEAILDPSGRLVVSESTTDKPDSCASVSSRANRGLILDGAESVLFRILACHRAPQWFWFLTHAQGQIRKKSYSVTPGTSRKSPIQTVDKVTRINTSIDLKNNGRLLDIEDPDQPFSSSVDVSKDTALSISDLVRQARADDGFDDNIEDARCEAYFLSNGHCVYLSRSMTDWIGELPISPETGEAAPADSLDTKDFGGNIELLSEFKQKRREIRIAHTKYLAQHPELRQILADYLQLLLHRKPQNVFEFTSTWLRPKKSE